MEAEVFRRLETIHPNSGPWSAAEGEQSAMGDVGAGARRGRRAVAGGREGRIKRRRERLREEKGVGGESNERKGETEEGE